MLTTEKVITNDCGMDLVFDELEYHVDHDNGDSAPLAVAANYGELDGGYVLNDDEMQTVRRWHLDID